ncbi:MAG: 2'-5' RNA ligase family protein, partial [Candidatus Hermodarchaeota archaeon]
SHLTIGRLNPNRINYKNFDTFKTLINDHKNFKFGVFTVDKVKLKKSDLTPQGPIYTDLKY